MLSHHPPSIRPSSPTRGVSYETVKAGRAPIPIQVAPKPSQARMELHPSMRPSSSPEPQPQSFTLRPRRSQLRDQDDRRDSGVGTAASTKRQSRATTVGTDRTDAESTKSGKAKSLTKKPSLPGIESKSASPSRKSWRLRMLGNGSNPESQSAPAANSVPRLPDSLLLGDIPSFSLEDLSTPDAIQFSKRGSLLFKGKRPSTSPSGSPRVSAPTPPSIIHANGVPDAEAKEKTGSGGLSGDEKPRTPEQPKPSSFLDIPSPSSTIPRSVLRPRRSIPNAISRHSTIQTRLITAEEDMLSRRIRSMYDEGKEIPISPLEKDSWQQQQQTADSSDSIGQVVGSDEERSTSSPVRTIGSQYSRVSVVAPPLPRVLEREENEIAGGMEDWQGVDSEQVDRYGFISKPPELSISVTSPGASYVSLPGSVATAPEGHGISRMATQLKLTAEAPRRSRSIRSKISMRRSSLVGRSMSPDGAHTSRMSSRERRSIANRPTSSQASYRSVQSSATSRLRRAANHLPQNKGRRAVDEAGDMLTLPPGLAEVAEAEALRGSSSSKALESRSAKERIREEKWRKMAKLVSSEHAPTARLRNKASESKSDDRDVAANGGGMNFTFDTTSAKVISRTWKGIPDRWRATAWWSFLSSSAQKSKESLSDQQLIDIFYDLLDRSSPDDVQIDLDVPRTIGGHVMFRKRYRGGQRLLFRVLHALSLYFPDPGYVQGMAALAATFLCYFQEELAFVMLVRMWELRGLAKLYRAGFDGLMAALDEFEQQWLRGGSIGEKLKELGITPTAYGTRWYLTVFNYSIPFSAQLRVWDVFLLLGEPAPETTAPPRPISDTKPTEEAPVAATGEPIGFDGTLDILHATSAALIDATREILLDSDFENAMKTLTSWIPVRDEDLLMRVAKVEWKLHRSQQHRGR